jgi:hypothetical protein
MDCQSPTSQNSPFLINRFADLGIVDFNIQSNWWVSLLQKSEFAVLVARFWEVGVAAWQFVGGQPKTPVVASIVCGLDGDPFAENNALT